MVSKVARFNEENTHERPGRRLSKGLSPVCIQNGATRVWGPVLSTGSPFPHPLLLDKQFPGYERGEISPKVLLPNVS